MGKGETPKGRLPWQGMVGGLRGAGGPGQDPGGPSASPCPAGLPLSAPPWVRKAGVGSSCTREAWAEAWAAGLGCGVPAPRPPAIIWGCWGPGPEQQGQWRGQLLGAGGASPARIPCSSDKKVVVNESGKLARGNDALLKRLLPKNTHICH